MPTHALPETPVGWHVDTPGETPRRYPYFVGRIRTPSAAHRRPPRMLRTNPPALPDPIDSFAERTAPRAPAPARSSASAHTPAPWTPPHPLPAVPLSAASRYDALYAAAFAAPSGPPPAPHRSTASPPPASASLVPPSSD